MRKIQRTQNFYHILMNYLNNSDNFNKNTKMHLFNYNRMTLIEIQ